MIPREILKKVRRIEIATRDLVNEVFSGEYHSVFKGRGMSFAEVREYQYGDDIRSIDWNVTARTGSPFVKVYEEERELTVMLVVDVSASGNFGTKNQMKAELATEISAVLAFSAINNSDKVGLIIFSDRIEKFVPPRKGRSHALRVLRELIYHRPRGTGTDVTHALEYLSHVTRRRSVVFLISDFLAPDFSRALSVAGRRHDVVAIRVGDPTEQSMPSIGLLEVEDAETGDTVLVDTSSRLFRQSVSQNLTKMALARRELFRRTKVDLVEVDTDKPYLTSLRQFFESRARRH
ncbi:MAG: DUF58 domain-containing protein [Gemmatimonadales bacterium]